MNAMSTRGLGAAAIAAVAFACILCGAAHAGYPYVGIYADTLGGPGGATHSRTETWALHQFDEIELWVWWLPDPSLGLRAGEYAITRPSVLLGPAEWTTNPSTILTLGDPTSGLSFTLGNNCQYDWFWSDRMTFFVRSTTETGYVQLIPDPTLMSPPYSVVLVSCEPDLPKYACTQMTTYVGINYFRCYPLPLNGATPQAFTELAASFVRPIFYSCGGLTDFKSIFRLYPKAAPADTIIVLHALATCPDYLDNGCDNFNLTLAAPMVDGTTYVLEALNYIESCICAGPGRMTCLEDYGVCGPLHSTFEFTFHAPVATLLRSSSTSLRGAEIEVAWELSAVDAGVSFYVSRSENGGEFHELDAARLVRDGLNFTYVDRSVEPGRSYTYKVEYGLGAPPRTLFISEAVSTPAMPLTLHQNKPNPFNPSTTISFYLPDQATVTLEVFDVSGRLVSRLIAGEGRGAGTHQVEWNGRDTRGGAVASGIYFYRLTAGKETVSKKAVLLR
jgi:hypothetical protein